MTIDQISTYFYVFGLSLMIVYLMIWFFLKTPLSEFFKDPPGKRKIHQRIVPRLGGVCLTVSFLLSVYLWQMGIFGPLRHLPVNLFDGIVFATLTIFVVGFLDDTYMIEIQNKAKFLLEVLIATELVFLLDLRFETINLFGIIFPLGWAAYPLTILWIVGVSNAINIIDGIDGLAGSIVLVSFLSVALFAGLAENEPLVTLSIIIAGSVSGFLLHNRSPARAFLGDTGSLFLGMIVGILSVYVVSIPEDGATTYPILVSFLLVGLPVLDVSAAMLRRFFHSSARKESFTKALKSMAVADNGHIHHRLVYRGFQHSEATLFLTFVQSTFCITALVIAQSPPLLSILASVYLMGLIMWLLVRLSFLESIKKIIYNRILTPKTFHNPYNIAVIDADPILKHALINYEQQDFHFHFFDRDTLSRSTSIEYTAIVFSNMQRTSFDDDLLFAHQIAANHNCPTILVSDIEKEQIPKDRVHSDGVVLHASRPVYIPTLLYELFSIAKHKSAGIAIKHNLINITKSQPITGWALNGKKFSKK